jgi:hypothetical protein
MNGIVPADGSLSGSLLTGFDTGGMTSEPSDPEGQFVAVAGGANMNAPFMAGPIAVANDVLSISTLLTSDSLDVA